MPPLNYNSLPTTRAEAKMLGVGRFFTGKPCRHGHLAPRYVSTTNCSACQVVHARRNGGWNARPEKSAYLEAARVLIASRGGLLISNEYVSAKSKLDVQC